MWLFAVKDHSVNTISKSKVVRGLLIPHIITLISLPENVMQ